MFPDGRDVDVALVPETLGPFQGSFSSKGGAWCSARGMSFLGGKRLQVEFLAWMGASFELKKQLEIIEMYGNSDD